MAENGRRATQVVLAFALASAVRGVLLALAFGALQVTPGIDWSRRLVGGVIGFTAACRSSMWRSGPCGNTGNGWRSCRGASRRAGSTRINAAGDAGTAGRVGGDDTRGVPPEDWNADGVGCGSGHPPTEGHGQRSGAPDKQAARRTPSWRPPPEPRAPELSFNAREFADDATRGRPLQPAWTALLFLCFGGPFLLYQLPTLYALQLLVAGALIVWILTVGANGLLWLVQDRSVVTRVVLLVVGVLLAASFWRCPAWCSSALLRTFCAASSSAT